MGRSHGEFGSPPHHKVEKKSVQNLTRPSPLEVEPGRQGGPSTFAECSIELICPRLQFLVPSRNGVAPFPGCDEWSDRIELHQQTRRRTLVALHAAPYFLERRHDLP